MVVVALLSSPLPLSAGLLMCVQAPKTVLEFERQLKALVKQKDVAAKSTFLQFIPPERYSSFFKQSLSEDGLEAIILAAHDCYLPAQPAAAAKVLCGLVTVARFDMLAMFLDRKCKQVVGKIVQAAIAGGMAEAELKQVKTKFKV